MEFFLQLLVNGVCVGLLYGISAMGFVMIFKSSSVLNFAHGELLALGGFFLPRSHNMGKTADRCRFYPDFDLLFSFGIPD